MKKITFGKMNELRSKSYYQHVDSMTILLKSTPSQLALGKE